LADDPGVVFTVKELIGRLDGKLDMMMNVLTNKADRTDVNALGNRVGALEDKVGEMHQREVEREAAKLAETRAETTHQENNRWVLGTVITLGLLMAAIGTIVVMLLRP